MKVAEQAVNLDEKRDVKLASLKQRDESKNSYWEHNYLMDDQME